jgi:hypothetical protein
MRHPLQFINRLMKMTPGLLLRKGAEKARNSISLALGRLGLLFSSPCMPDSLLLRKTGFSSLDALANHLTVRERPRGLFCSCTGDKESLSLLKSRFPREVEGILRAGDDAAAHCLDILGSGKTCLGDKIDWHRDFKAGYGWNPSAYYRDVKIPQGVADIKVPWELSRFQFLNAMGLAYWITGDEKYPREFSRLITDWVEKNPPRRGVNWSCTMDAAIRACSWIGALDFFRKSPSLDRGFFGIFMKSIIQHGLHIFSNLEWSERFTSNHYLSDIAGLFFIAVSFPVLKESAGWKSFAVESLRSEIKKQVYPDGCGFEGSTCYHGLALELFFFCALLGALNDGSFNGGNYRDAARSVFGEDFVSRLYAMFEALAVLTKPGGRLPQLGDNDSGRFFSFPTGGCLDLRYLASLGAVFFSDASLCAGESSLLPELLCLLGSQGFNRCQALMQGGSKGLESRGFADAGWYVSRKGGNYLLISCGPNGQNDNGGHCHNDKLGFELQLGGEDALIDPGTGLYTSNPAVRNALRGTRQHNTVIIDGEEQNRFIEGELFQMLPDARAECLEWKTGEEKDTFAGRHHGYERLANPVCHAREFVFHKKKGVLEVTDRFEGQGKHMCEWNLILPPGRRRGELFQVSSDLLDFREDEALYSPAYGVVVETTRLTARVEAEAPVEFRFTVSPAR